MAIWMNRSTEHLHAHGRRRRAVDRPGAVHEREAHLREPGRRHLLPQRDPRDPRRGRRAGVNITYKILYNDAVAMTGGQPFDGPLTPAEIAQPGAPPRASRRSSSSRDEPDKYPPATSPRGIAIHHRDELDAVQRELRDTPGLYGPDLRPDLRRGEAPPPQARQVSRSREARLHQRARLRRLRRLRRASRTACRSSPVETEFGRKRDDRPDLVQQGLLLRQRLLPELRHRRRRQRCGSRRRRSAGDLPALPEPALAGDARALRHPRHRHRRHRRHHDRRAARHGRASRGQGRLRARHDRASRRRTARSSRTCGSPTRPRSSTRRASPPATRS